MDAFKKNLVDAIATGDCSLELKQTEAIVRPVTEAGQELLGEFVASSTFLPSYFVDC